MKWLSLIGWGVGIAFLVLFFRQMLQEEVSWRLLGNRLELGTLLVSLLALYLGQVVFSQISYVSHQRLDHTLSRAKAYRFWFIAQIAKYLPGGIWLAPARIFFYRREGMPLLLASACTLWEIVAVLTGGILAGLALVGQLGQSNWALAVALSGAALLAAVLLSLQGSFWRLLARFGIKRATGMAKALAALGGRRYTLMLHLTAVSVVAWLIVGLGFYLLLASVGAGERLNVLEAGSMFAVAWVVGFLVFLTPVGMGPREAMLVLLLSPSIGAAEALAAALLSRLWWTAGDGGHFLIASLWATWAARRSPTVN
ncbi:MAG: hypothetical protein DYG88_17345 [Chloroflexi bacterium CFX4]|nr:hypothetical protein [Chloroflexi bacterium CFX4]MDL1924480.1 hypothetical protein [Chloroflexi bacterium CFX3]